MRILSGCLIIATLLLTACADMATSSGTRYQLEENANQFVGDNIQTVLKQWGAPDQAMHTAENTSYYVYTTKTDTSATANTLAAGESPIVVPGNKSIGVPIESEVRANNAPVILCTTTFKTNNQGTILWAKHQGSSCLGKWVNTTEK
jgi:hypothetical protein